MNKAYKLAEPFLGKPPWNFGHRGTRSFAPENTLAAFNRVYPFTKAFELDVILCKSRELIVFHDASLKRTTNGSGEVKDKNLSELLSLDAGQWFSDEFKGEKIPTLRQIFEKLPLDCFFNIEIKQTESKNETVLALLADLQGHENRVFVSSFDWNLLEILEEKNPQLVLGALFEKGEFPSTYLPSFPIFLPHHSDIKEAASQTWGSLVIPYTVNSKEDWDRCLDLGCSGLITDHPDLLKDYLLSKGK